VRMAYQGEPGAYSEAAALRFDAEAELLPCPTFPEVFAAVADEAWAGLRERLRAVRRDRRVPFAERIRLAYLAYFQFVVDERPLYDVLERLLWARGDQASSNLRLSIEELREDLLPDAQEGALGGDDPDLVATAMVGMGLMVARRMLARGKLDPEEAATFCTNFALRGARDRTGATRRRSA